MRKLIKVVFAAFIFCVSSNYAAFAEDHYPHHPDVLLDSYYSGVHPDFNDFYGAYDYRDGDYIMDYSDLIKISPAIVLGDNDGFLCLPTGSYVVVGFSDNTIIDSPGKDFMIYDVPMPSLGLYNFEADADVYVSSDNKNFVYIGDTWSLNSFGSFSFFDLADIGFSEPVTAIKIVGLNNHGWWQSGKIFGFPLVYVGVPDSSLGSPPQTPENISHINGDPHIVTFDGLGYDFQAAGEFIYIESTADPAEMTVQTRFQPMQNSGDVSVTTAAAMNVAGDKVEIYLNQSPHLYINGVPNNDLGADGVDIPNGGNVSGRNNEYKVVWPDSSLITFKLRSQRIDVYAALTDERKNQIRGLSGNLDDNPANDFAIRDGGYVIDTTVTALTKDILYGAFGESWRISQAESLFTYFSPGESTESHTDRNFPGKLITANDLPETQYNQAKIICENAGVSDPTLLKSCILDVGLSGDADFAKGFSEAKPPTYLPGGMVPIYRFYSEGLMKHLFTVDQNEKNNLIETAGNVWRYEGASWYVFPDSQNGTSPVYRFYSEQLQSHLFTTYEDEKNTLIATFTEDVWRYEGVGFYVPTDYQVGTLPVYRFYSENLQVHLFTIDENEKNHLIDNAGDVWTFEGVAYYAYP